MRPLPRLTNGVQPVHIPVQNEFIDGRNQLLPRVEELLQSGAAPDSPTVHKLAAELKATGVKILDLRRKGLAYSAAIGTLGLLLSESEVEVAQLGGNDIGARGAARLAAALPLSRVKVLTLEDNRLDAAAAVALAGQLPAGLKVLYLSGNPISEEGKRVVREVCAAAGIALAI